MFSIPTPHRSKTHEPPYDFPERSNLYRTNTSGVLQMQIKTSKCTTKTSPFSFKFCVRTDTDRYGTEKREKVKKKTKCMSTGLK